MSSEHLALAESAAENRIDRLEAARRTLAAERSTSGTALTTSGIVRSSWSSEIQF